MDEIELKKRFLGASAVAREAGDLARRLFESREAGTYQLKGLSFRRPNVRKGIAPLGF